MSFSPHRLSPLVLSSLLLLGCGSAVMAQTAAPATTTAVAGAPAPPLTIIPPGGPS